MKDHKNNRSNYIHSESNYQGGKTELNEIQVNLIKEISMILNGYSDNYDNLHFSYASSGIIAVLRDQVVAKIENGTINPQERRDALQLIRKLEIDLEMDFTEIYEMKDLIKMICENNNISKYEFRVKEYNEYESRRTYRNPITSLSFGNKIRSHSYDIVDISIFLDKVNLQCVPEGARKYSKEFDPREVLSLEQKIIYAVDTWTSYYSR
ncbi:hypothetical protein MHB84_05450 [Paenibacillus sp. FSL F4-0087]|uniref:hypothetical protein n=1 Tax=Paenibacillus sp. FSL F4-0087 TaxID=2921368 RepID=UPI00096D2FD6|nr:hypothetical protein BK122_27420 [Paenibacillus pabuli]